MEYRCLCVVHCRPAYLSEGSLLSPVKKKLRDDDSPVDVKPEKPVKAAATSTVLPTSPASVITISSDSEEEADVSRRKAEVSDRKHHSSNRGKHGSYPDSGKSAMLLLYMYILPHLHKYSACA